MSTVPRVLLTGGLGQLGSALVAVASDPGSEKMELRAVGRAQLDITDEAGVSAVVADFQPHVIINAAAYTAVDQAESDVDGAARINERGAAIVARAAGRCGARLIHVSTDFVFDGRQSTPYRPDDPTGPLSVYGATKLAGERRVMEILPSSSAIVRTAWLYSAGGRNFVRTMLRLMRERGQVRVVSDQVGTPTSAGSLAKALWRMAARPNVTGVFHWTDAGVASWYDFAVAIAEEAAARGLLTQPVTITPVTSSEYVTPARRPSFSVLDCRTTHDALGLASEHWRINLRAVLQEVAIA